MSCILEWLICKYLKIRGAKYCTDVWMYNDEHICDFSSVVYYSYWSFSGIRSSTRLDVVFPTRVKTFAVNIFNLPIIILNLNKAIKLVKNKGE